MTKGLMNQVLNHEESSFSLRKGSRLTTPKLGLGRFTLDLKPIQP